MGDEKTGCAAPEPLTIEDFAGRTGQAFDVEAGGVTVRLVLAEVTALPRSPRAGGSFRLEFAAPSGSALPQGIYDFSIDGADRGIFLVPIGPNRDGELRHEAVFF